MTSLEEVLTSRCGECDLPMGRECLPLVVGECDLPMGGSAYL